MARHALEHQCRCAVGKRAIEDIGVAGHPADVGGAPVDIIVVAVEHPLMGERGIDQIAAGGVQHALGTAGGTGSVENEQRIFRAHRGDGAIGGDAFCRLVIIDVAPFLHGDGPAGALHHQNLGNAWALFERRIDIGLERHLAATAQAFVGGDHHRTAGVADAAGKAVGREAGEDDRMHRADAGSCQHGEGGFRNHRQIDGEAIAPPDAGSLQYVGKAADLLLKLAIGDGALFGGVVALPQDRHLVWRAVGMAVDAIVGGVENAVFVPADRYVVRVVGGILYAREGFDPVEAAGHRGPEAIGIVDGAFVELQILVVIDKGRRGKRRRYLENLTGHPNPPRARPSSATRPSVSVWSVKTRKSISRPANRPSSWFCRVSVQMKCQTRVVLMSRSSMARGTGTS